MTVYSEWIRKFIVYALAAYIFLVSIMFTIATENTVLIKATFGQTLIFGLTMLWFARLLEEGKFKFLPAEFNVPLVVLLLGCTLSLALSPFQYYSLMEMAHFVSYFLSVWLIYNNVRTKFEFSVLLWSLFASAVYSIVYAIMQKMGLDPIEWGMPVFISTFGNANFFAAFLMLALPTMLGMMIAYRSWLVRILVAVWLLAGLWCLIYTKTRSAWLGFLIAMFVFFCVQLLWGGIGHYLHNWRRNGIILCVLALMVVWVFAAYNPTDYLDEFESSFKIGYGIEGGTNQVRLVMWMGAAKMWAEKPLFGQSIGTFRLMFPRFRPSYYHRWNVSHNTDYPHNDYAGVAADQGMFGLLIFGWFWWTVIYSLGRGIKREQNWFWRQMLVGLLCAWIAHLGDNATSPHLRWPATAVAAFFVVGLGFSALRLGQNAFAGKQRALPLTLNHNPLKYIAFLVLAAVFAFSAFLEWRVYKGELLMKQGEGALNAAGGSPNDSNRNIWNAAKAAFEESLKSNPFNHSVLYKLAYINLQMGKTADALASYEKLMAIAPHYAQIHYNVGLVYQLLGTDPNDPLRAIRPFQSLEQFRLATRIEDYPHNQTLTGSTLIQMAEYRRAISQFSHIPDAQAFDWQRKFYNAIGDLRTPTSLRMMAADNDDARRVARVVYTRALSLTGTARGMTGGANNLKLQRYYYQRALVWHPYESEVMLRQAENARAAGNFPLYADRLTTVISNTTPAELGDNMVRNNFSMALNLVAQHVNENQQNDKFWDLLAIGQMKLGDLPKAMQCAQNAITINPNNQLARQRLADIQRLMAGNAPARPAPDPGVEEQNRSPQMLQRLPNRSGQPLPLPSSSQPRGRGFIQ